MGLRDDESNSRRNDSHHRHNCCNGGHCYHTYPGTYGGGRSDTYDPTLCCKCGQSEPNPYENERR